nr:hypothetical protein [uncultured Schaedlerella sp.]
MLQQNDQIVAAFFCAERKDAKKDKKIKTDGKFIPDGMTILIARYLKHFEGGE